MADTRKTADAYWGTGPRLPLTAEQRDPHGLGEPPRELGPQLERYVKRATYSLFPVWVMLAVFFGLGDVVGIAASGKFYPPLLTLGFVALAVWTGRKRAERRRRLRRVMRDGQFTDAEVKNIHVVEQRYRHRVVYIYHVLFDLGDRQVLLITRDPGASLLQVGLRDQVLWLSAEPDLVVPTFLVAAG
jgi:hypothetical protein